MPLASIAADRSGKQVLLAASLVYVRIAWTIEAPRFALALSWDGIER